MRIKYKLFLLIGILVFSNLLVLNSLQHTLALDDIEEPIVPSSPTDVFIVEEAKYDGPIGNDRPIVTLRGVIYWEQLGGSLLNFFLNTSDVISNVFWDFQTKEEFFIGDACAGPNSQGLVIPARTNCVRILSDRYWIVPDQRSFAYEIVAYYDPDIIEDTGFIVIFNSQSVDFSINVDGQEVFAKVDYRNVITLPVGAGVVSAAPLDDGYKGLTKIQTDEGVRWQLTWEYKHRALDSKHDPLIIEVTYKIDELYLKFTEQVYQNQIENQKKQDQENRLDLLNASFVVIASIAVIASIFSILLAYLIAKRKFESDLHRAKELPKRSVSDIEESDSLKIPTKSLILTVIIIVPLFFFTPLPANAQIENQNVIWKGEYDLRKDLTLTETVQITLPVKRDVVYIYTNVSQVINFQVVDEFGSALVWEPDPEGHRYKILNPTLTYKYIMEKPYKIHNNSQILVYLDRFWVEFASTSGTFGDEFFRVDLTYTVLLPEGAFLYSASPTSSMDPTMDLSIMTTTDGRWNVTFSSKNRQMDAFHDPFETQITFSFVSILEALENLNTKFEIAKLKNQDVESLVNVASSEVLLFSILGLIAPLISFFIAYWVFRNRYKKKIEDFEEKQEEQIFVEAPQILALAYAVEKNGDNQYYQSFVGHYWKLSNEIERIIKKDLSILSNDQIISLLKSNSIRFDEMKLIELLSRGKQRLEHEEEVDYGELYEYAKEVEELLLTIRRG